MGAYQFLVVSGGKPTRVLSSALSLDSATTPGQIVEFGQFTTALALKIDTAAIGAANGVASLDSGGKIPIGQLPASVVEYKGTYNPNTNTPTLADGTGISGQFYKITAAGSHDFGSGAITFVVGDWAIYNGSTWEKSHSGADTITSVNGQTGVVSLVTDNISEGTTNLYYTSARFSSDFASKSTTNLAEGSNLYFTTARAKAAAVANAITSGVTDVAPSQDAVFQALALKADASAAATYTESGLTNNQGAAITARQVVYLSAAGQVQLAVATNAALGFSKYRMVSDASIANGAPGVYYKPGAVVSGFTSLVVGQPIYLSHGTAGGYAQDLSAHVTGDAVVLLGFVLSATSIEFNPEFLYVY